MSTHKYFVGPYPYAQQSAHETKGNNLGDTGWMCKADSMDEALRTILGELPFPGECTGRANLFFPGVSIPGLPDSEVIQVWSNDPEAAAQMERFAPMLVELYGPRHPDAAGGLRIYRGDGENDRELVFPPHDGTGLNLALLAEIPVADLAQWRSANALLGDGTAPASETGQQLARFAAIAHEGRRRKAALQLKMARHAQMAEATEAELQREISATSEKLEFLRLYTNSINGATRLAKGPRADSAKPYALVQTLTHIDAEMGSLACFERMDFRNLDAVDEWLRTGQRWKKFLPHEKCVLASRICERPKEYADPWDYVFFNQLNMACVVWVRDGENCVRLGCDIRFKDEIFPAADNWEKELARTQEAVWKTCAPTGTPTMDAWLDSELYPPALRQAITNHVRATMFNDNTEAAKLLVWLQGVVDKGGVFAIPPGTNLNDPARFAEHFSLVMDNAGLDDPRGREAYDQARRDIQPGDWILVHNAMDGQDCDDSLWHNALVQVRAAAPNSLTIRRRKRGRRKRWAGTAISQYFETHEIHREDEWLPLSLDPSIVARLLDDRVHKKLHRWTLPFLLRWNALQDHARNPDHHGWAVDPADLPILV